MNYNVTIDGKRVYRSSNHNEARMFADGLYNALMEIRLEGCTEDDDEFGYIVSENSDINREVVIAINGRNYEDYLAKEDWISNRLKEAV